MRFFPHLEKHQVDLFESLCWIYYPILDYLWKHHHRSTRLFADNFRADCLYANHWAISNKDNTGIIKCSVDMAVGSLTFWVKLPLMRSFTFKGQMFPNTDAHLLSPAIIVAHSFSYDAFKSEIRRGFASDPDADKVYFDWVSEIKHLSTLAKVSL